MDQIEYIKSNKGGVKIIYKGYMYTIHKNKKCGGIRWRCAQRSFNCKGSISTNLSGEPNMNMPHNHLPDYKSIAVAKNKYENNLGEDMIYNVAEFILPNVWEPLTALKDSMPLEQRLKSPPDQEPVLQSQPLSPTKLKVTRQSAKPPQPSPKPPTPEPPNEEVCLRWNSHHSNMQSSFPNLLMKEQYVDATLVAEGQSLKCHRLILSSCSPYFEEVLSGISPFQHPVLFMKDIPFWVLKSLCDFMYAGEVHIFQNKLEELLAVAESLKIKGLAGKMDGSNEEPKTAEPPKPVKEEKKEEVKEKKRNFQFFESTPRTSTRPVRAVQASKKPEKANKDSFNKEGILDPLDLLEPVYEEVTKESAPVKIRETKTVPLKRGKLKKRKFSEEREESPPPMFLSRKGTRSRPNVKIPKYYHTHYERMSESTIVREPHTTQPDPLLPLEDIKSEPLDMENDVIEIEDNVIGFTEIPEIPPHDEEIIGNYDSPLVNLNDTADKTDKEETIAPFKKINLVAQPIIMNVHSVTEKSPSTLQIVDIAQLTNAGEKCNDPLATIGDTEGNKVDDPLTFIHEPMGKGTSGITITNVHSVVETPETEERANDTTDAIQEQVVESVEESVDCQFRIEKVVTEKDESNEIEVLCATENEKESQDETEMILPNVCKDKTIVAESIPSPKTLLGDAIEVEELPAVEKDEEAVLNTCDDEVEEPSVELGFHIAKVASEQFTSIGDINKKDVISEDCASELGFQITDVVSGSTEDSDQVPAVIETHNCASSSEVGTFANDLEESKDDTHEAEKDVIEFNSVVGGAGDSSSEDTQFLAESLEKLLDK